MKKIIFSTLLFINALFAASCEIHWGIHSWYVPPAYIVVPAIVFSVVCIVISYAVSMGYICRHDYKCPECGSVIKPKWYHFSAWLHINNDRVVKCPHCKRKGFCRRID